MIFTKLFFLLATLWSQENINCLEIEGVNIGCTTAQAHSCYLNKKVEGEAVCRYAANYSTYYRVEGIIDFQCKSWDNKSVTNTVCNADGCQTTTTTTKTCTQYLPPVCNEECIGCFDNLVKANIGVSRGCIVCTREYCSDEPVASVYCPKTYQGMKRTRLMQCGTPSRCPATATDPLGAQHNVRIVSGQCPEEPIENFSETMPQHCPWKVDKRSATGCEPIEEDNRNP